MFKHTALGGHWMILAAVYLFVRHGKDYFNTKKAIGMLGDPWGANVSSAPVFSSDVRCLFVRISVVQLLEGETVPVEVSASGNVVWRHAFYQHISAGRVFYTRGFE